MGGNFRSELLSTFMIKSKFSILHDDPILMCLSICVQVISLEGWVDIMYYVQDAHSFWDWIYFVLLIVVSFYSHIFCLCH